MRLTILVTIVVFASACNNNKSLRVFGPKVPVARIEDGKTVIDSIDYTIPSFTFTDQDSSTVDSSTLDGKIFVADFFFTSCPSICPKMMAEMLKVNDKFKNNNDVAILSYSIDPVRDSVARLKLYQKKLGVESGQWHFLTGNKDSIYHLAEKYLVSAGEDPDAPGGHIHSGNFVLVDKHKRIRGYYDGTTDEGTEKMMSQMDILLNEK